MIKLEKLNKNEALRYLGYKEKDVDEMTYKNINKTEKELLEIITPRYLYKCFDIVTADNEIELVGCSLKLAGKDIVNHLEKCEKALLLCATLGDGVDKYIRCKSQTDMALAVIADSLCSAAIEQVCDLAEKEMYESFKEYNKTFRFSPGYGDLPIELQAQFLSVLDANKRIGLYANESSLLLPRKSVTAVIGLSKDKIERKKSGCISCRMYNTCEFRKRGVHCGD